MSRNSARLAVAEFTIETMGLMPIGFLCIFFRKYMMAVLTLVGGQKFAIFGDSRPALRSCSVSLTNLVTSAVWSLSSDR